MVASLPVAGGALFAARPFARASARYSILAAGFALSAAIGPLALLSASLRPAATGSGGTGLPGTLLTAGAVPALAAAGAVAAMLLIALAADVVKLRRVKQRASTIGRLSVRRALLGTSTTVAMPTAIGYVHPAVILPANFRARVDEREWNAVVAHECAHLARRDDWAKAAQSAIVRLGWWVPGLWVLNRALDLERELASDERAADHTGPRHYAACLLRLATERNAGLPAPGFGGRRSHVAIRVERLLRPSPARSAAVRAAALGAFTALALAVVAGAVVALPGSGPSVALRPAVAERAPKRRAPAPPRVAQRIEHRTARPHAQARPSVAAIRVPAAPLAVRRSSVAVRPGPHMRRNPVASVKPAPAAFTIAFVFPRTRCATCFGPFRTPDDAVTPASGSAPGEASSGSVTITSVAPDDAASGPVSLSSDAVWLRLPARSISGP